MVTLRGRSTPPQGSPNPCGYFFKKLGGAMKKKIRFVQIAGNDKDFFALDERGRVWQRIRVNGKYTWYEVEAPDWDHGANN